VIYIHIPFCRSFCTYCGFYSEISDSGCAERFSEALLLEIDSRRREIPSELNTLYIGGGTPSVLPPNVFRHIVAAVKLACGQESFDEFTVEVNPDDITKEYAETLVSMGVNRVSMGVQSFDDGILRWMNRRHDAEAAVRSYKLLRAAGLKNISIDLIFGLPQLCGNSVWAETVEKAVSLRPEHISAYQLSVEPDSVLETLVDRGDFIEASDEECRRQYDMLCAALSAAGYSHYEVSNFALDGYRAIHNSGYWKHIPYIGFGPAAHSFLQENGCWVRSWNEPDLRSYLAGARPVFEKLSDTQIEMEEIMLGLRTCDGATVPPSPARDRLVSKGFLESVPESSEHFRIPSSQFFVSDSIIRELI